MTKKDLESTIKKITSKEIREAKSIQHTFNHDTLGESILYILNRMNKSNKLNK